MAKPKVRYICSECGGVQMKWMGKCPDCDEWNTLEETVIRSRRENLWFLPSGRTPEDASGLLSGKRMEDLAWEMKRRFDYVLVTAPSVHEYADAGVLAGHVDHAILVSSLRRHALGRLEKTSRALGSFGVSVSGVLLSRLVRAREVGEPAGGAHGRKTPARI